MPSFQQLQAQALEMGCNKRDVNMARDKQNLRVLMKQSRTRIMERTVTSGMPVSEVSAIAQIRALEHEMFEEVQHKPLPDSDDELQDIDNVIFSGDEDEQISVRVCVGDSPEEVVDVDPTANVVQTLRRELGIKGAACKMLSVDLP